jgi:hypothetical protein
VLGLWLMFERPCDSDKNDMNWCVLRLPLSGSWSTVLTDVHIPHPTKIYPNSRVYRGIGISSHSARTEGDVIDLVNKVRKREQAIHDTAA